MIVPRYWAEARIAGKIGTKQVTVKRFGWSESSQEDAQQLANTRAKEAFEQVARGIPSPRREPKVAYNGAEGVPIREEIVSRHGDTVITRNSYGALCLNTPNVLFVDIDLDTENNIAVWCSVMGIGVILALGVLITQKSCFAYFVAAGIMFLSGMVVQLIYSINTFLHGNPAQHTRARINAFLESKPEWNLRLYRTPRGFRVLVMHRTFDPAEAEVAECFNALNADPLYAQMCLRQHCFRARVSPKPWRIGMKTHIRPRGTWPIDPVALPVRTKWIEQYNQMATSYASCEFIETLGSGMVNSTTQAVKVLHDELSRVERNLPLA